MIFSSYFFLFVFLPLLLLVHSASPPRARNLILLVASYVFYGYWRLDFTLLLLASSLVDFACGLGIYQARSERLRRGLLFLSIAFNLGLLGYFKYFNFGLDSLNEIVLRLGGSPLTWERVILPVGISFFTFQTMSYTIDVYRRQIQPTRSLLTGAPPARDPSSPSWTP